MSETDVSTMIACTNVSQLNNATNTLSQDEATEATCCHLD
jgi:hypothetical protein